MGSGMDRVNDPGFVVTLGQQQAKLVGCCLGCLNAWKSGDGLPVAVDLVLELKGVGHGWWPGDGGQGACPCLHIVAHPLRSAQPSGGQFTNRNASASGQQLPHPPAAAPQPLGNAGLAEPLAPPAAGPIAVGFGGPGDHRQDDQQGRQHPQQGARDGGHGSLVVVTNRGAQASPGDQEWCAGSLRLPHHNACGHRLRNLNNP